MIDSNQPSPRPPHSLDAIFQPRAIAVVGASRRPGSLGFALLHNLVRAQVQAAIYPVNPKADLIHSFRCHPTVGAIPDQVDLAVVVVPRDAVEAAVDDCLEHGVRGLVVITAGFTETGEEGARLERRIRDKVRAAGARMIGPNCMGVINTDPNVRLDATFSPTPAEPGAVGFVSQSGALGVAILNFAAQVGLGLTQFVSMGNKADVSGNDLLEYWEEDERTRVICLYLESFGNPRRFAELAKRVGRKKPIVIVKSGRTAAGARAASSHTGALAGADLTVSTFLEHCGVLRVATIEELFDTARALERCPLPTGRRVLIVTNAGGPGIMATDACVDQELELADLAPTTLDGLRALLPPEASVLNPIDMIASADAHNYEEAMAIALADPAVDLALAIYVPPVPGDPTEILEAITRGIRRAATATGAHKPVLAVMMAAESFHQRNRERRDLPPVYRFPESAARALARLERYAAWRRRPVGDEAPQLLTKKDHDAIAELLTEDGFLPTDAALRVLEHCGIAVADWTMARGVDAAAEYAAARLAARPGAAVVLKAEARGLIHKSELDAVAVGLTSAAEVRAQAEKMHTRLAAEGFEVDGFLVQDMVRGGGREVVFGVSTDPDFGPLLMFGLGGKYVEVLDDVRFGISPLTERDADEMINGLRGGALLRGTRGESSVDHDVLRDVLLRLAELVQHHPRIQEIDINPFLAFPVGGPAAAVDVRIRVGSATPDSAID